MDDCNSSVGTDTELEEIKQEMPKFMHDHGMPIKDYKSIIFGSDLGRTSISNTGQKKFILIWYKIKIITITQDCFILTAKGV